MSTLILILIAAVCNSLALTMLKITGDRLRTQADILPLPENAILLVFAGLGLYGISFLLTIRIFLDSQFSQAVPMFVGFSILSSLFIAIGYFKEDLTASLILGSLLIIAGVYVINSNAL
jgi:multidrug transporter EmrE-like cation transporter